MPGGGGDTAIPPPADGGGEFLLSLLQKKPHHHFHHHPQTPTHPLPSRHSSETTPPPQQQQKVLTFDPAVAAMGPTVAFSGGPWLPSATTDLSAPWPHTLSPPPYQHVNRFSQQNTGNNSQGNQFLGIHGALGDNFRRLGFSGADANMTHHLLQQKPQDHKLMFGSLPFEIQNQTDMFNGNSLLDKNRQLDPRVNSNSDPSNAFRHGIYNSRELQELRGGIGGGWGQHQQHTPASETRRPPPGFPSKPGGGGGIWDIVDREKGNFSDLSKRGGSISDADDKGRRFFSEDSRTPMSNMSPRLGLSKQQFDLHRRHNIDSEIADHENGDENQGRGWDGLRPGYDRGSHELDDLGEEIVHSLLLEDDSNDKSEQKQNRNARDKDCRSDSRGQRLLSQRMRNLKRMMGCRDDIYKLNAPFLAIYESLIPPEKEKENQRQLFTLLEKLVAKEWPEARLYLYGSCASTFGVRKSDIDVCLAIDDIDVNKPKVLLKLAEILQSDNLENVQALTRARVPIVKLMDPVTGISCDICINNVLAVVNTKLLRDYAQIDVRLHQLAFIVKHWAKSRGVNETYQGTLSSYAYVLMCIHFLQQRRPAILPCLQEMETTYSVTVDDIKCAFFDKVEKLRSFGSRNRESIAQLVWGFFNYWAYCHDYANDVISVRTGSIISKRAKDWTRRIGNDRHLICIEDPFEISHDLGRVVDKYSIKVLREEFERAADIMQFDPNPCMSLFEPYVVS